MSKKSSKLEKAGNKGTKAQVHKVQDLGAKLTKVDSMVKAEGEVDVGAPKLALCPRCGSSDLAIRKIDIPGFAPEVQVCNRCGFRSESAVQVDPLEYVEDVEEEAPRVKIEDIEKRLQSTILAEKKGGKQNASKGSKPVKSAKPAKPIKPVAKPAKKPVQKPSKKKKR